jgi:predicted NUDIX family NTP pyrophosphohydrolase
LRLAYGLLLEESNHNTMSRKHSAGLVVHRLRNGVLEILLVHPGGPFWAKRDLGAWSIPKGEFDATEESDPLLVARRELEEETGYTASGHFVPLADLRQPSGKVIHAWAVEADFDASSIRSNTFSMEWPPRSGKSQEFPEVDRAEWFPMPQAKERILRGQRGFLEQLQQLVGGTL